MTLNDPNGGVAEVQHRPTAGAKNRRFWGSLRAFQIATGVATYAEVAARIGAAGKAVVVSVGIQEAHAVPGVLVTDVGAQ